ncbi:substrate-binding periplasmic protein [Chitinibacter sp. S2-10]|uniref:substrate-binding periplasmic protein n=1 Tax=Chitinibacter sp. S2-10 TaxID=3373597 RepID=UPI0039772A45
MLRICGWIGALLLSTAAFAEETLRVGYFDLPPHAQFVQGQHSGAALAYFDLIAKQMGVNKVIYTQLPLSRLLKDQKIDLILYLGKTPEREKQLRFSRQAWLKMQGTLTVKSAGAIQRIQSKDDLAGLSIGVWQDGYRSPLIMQSQAHLDLMAGDEVVRRSLQKVVLGRMDGFYSPEASSVQQEMRRLGLNEQLRVLNLPEPAVALCAAFRPAAVQYLPRYEQALEKLSRTLPYSEFLRTRPR